MIIQRGIKFEIAGDKEEACRHVLVRFKAEGRNLHFEDSRFPRKLWLEIIKLPVGAF